jgi:lipopolysaccharide transport system permease protein
MQANAARSIAQGAPFEPFWSLWRNRELYQRVLVRDIQTAFRGSVLGLAWVVLIPLVLVAVYTFVFGAVLKSTWASEVRSPHEVPLLFFGSLTVFAFFMEVVSRAPNFIRENKTYVTKVIFPLDILCWVLVGTALLKLFVNLALLSLFLLIFTGGLPVRVLLVPFLLVPFVLLTMGIAWLLAAAGAYVRDLAHAVTAVAPVLVFITPVFYSVQQVPEGFRGAYFLNPLTFILERMRDLLFFDRAFSIEGYAIYCAVALAVFMLGFAFFQRLRAGFSDVV